MYLKRRMHQVYMCMCVYTQIHKKQSTQTHIEVTIGETYSQYPDGGYINAGIM